MADRGTVLVAGAGGLVGRAVIEHDLGLGWHVIALSRRPPEPATGAAHLSVDLTDAAQCRARLAEIRNLTHLVYAALYEKPDLTGGWLDDDQIAVNRAMLANLLDAVEPQNPGLRHLTLLQGAKAYGVHLGQIPVPARERAPRHIHPNFYWAQEDFLRARQAGKDWRFTILRPQVVLGFAHGSAMNMVAALGAYAAISRELGLPLAYPGTGTRVTEATDARLLARAVAWAGQSEAAANQTYNVTNGDVLTWENLWPVVARAFRMEVGLPHPMPLSRIMPGRAATWQAIVARHNLTPLTLDRLVGASWQFADFAVSRTHSTASLLSTIKIRQAGFHDCIDTEDSLAWWLAHLQERRLLPE
ncbi:SDR family oxidoreductase [Methylobacterium nonmethylotrophicum]|uniref:SDR family oxidoreductase n=1 Tax=Methylobacterium nonmethylotrophicum TaxID=1141884 RepID=A0A4Z0NVA7_9HYPH|nr:SDR family oxidoreductase [Methylobacterium nonmethylotrophicum]TGE01653.1 SDR family oxidoreductase [Methylobacterium nonmethylotrophicum]